MVGGAMLGSRWMMIRHQGVFFTQSLRQGERHSASECSDCFRVRMQIGLESKRAKLSLLALRIWSCITYPARVGVTESPYWKLLVLSACEENSAKSVHSESPDSLPQCNQRFNSKFHCTLLLVRCLHNPIILQLPHSRRDKDHLFLIPKCWHFHDRPFL